MIVEVALEQHEVSNIELAQIVSDRHMCTFPTHHVLGLLVSFTSRDAHSYIIKHGQIPCTLPCLTTLRTFFLFFSGSHQVNV